jgi:peptide/nickel transport system substrate-binding protein
MSHVSLSKYLKTTSLAAVSFALLSAGATTGAHADDRAALMAAHRGGSMRLVSNAAAGTLDPMINYTAQYWQVYQSLYDGLLAFKHVGGPEAFTIVPDLAEALPTLSNDGKTYTFKLRKGIQFSDGREVTTKDVVASFQRIFKVASPTAGSFYNGIVGAEACLKTPATCTLDGGITADEATRTITINLTAPDSEFLYKLAVPHASVLPADAPSKDAGTTIIPGTGAYMVTAYDPNTAMKLARNPKFKEWSVDAQPDGFVDTIQYDFGLKEEAAITAIENGQADWMFDPPPPDRLPELGSKFQSQVHLTPLTAVWYAPMNTNLPPFNDERVRKALNYAVDRDALVGLFGGVQLATPTCQILPPDFPGYQPSCLYTKDPGTTWSAPDLDKAKALVKESGTAGQKVTVISDDTANSKAIGTYLQSVLHDLGYDASLTAISANTEFNYIQNTNNKVQISVTQWFQDYPAASDFLNVLFGCASFTPGSDSSVNIAGYCNKDLDASMQKTMALAVTDPKAANAEWAKIDAAYMEKAPWVPMFNPKQVDFVSKRIGNFNFSYQYHWLFANSWVK